jgi:pimeloyl-ACP methyl ester carboxylesterase
MDRLIERSMQIAGHRTRVLELEGSGPGIVLLHGWHDNADGWRPLLLALSAYGRRAIAVDLPGFGQATSLGPGAILPQLDDFVLALVHQWGAGEPVVVAGNTLGGAVALRLAEQADQLAVAGVVPVAPDGLADPGWFDGVERDPVIRALLDIPIPVPGALVRSLRATDGRRAHDVSPFDLDAAACPVLLVQEAQLPEDLLEVLLTFPE